MDGKRRSLPLTLRPQSASLPFELPRRLLRQLVFGPRLTPGRRVIVGGNYAESTTRFLVELGIDAYNASSAKLNGPAWDAIIWLDLEPSPHGERSLLSAAALGHTASLLAALKPGGTATYAQRIAATAAGHEVACLEQHFTIFPGEINIEQWTSGRSLTLGWLQQKQVATRYAVATYERPATDIPASEWRRCATAVACGLSVPCCRWAAQTSEKSPVAA